MNSDRESQCLIAEEMPYSQKLRSLFPEITLHAEDLLLLETFQVKNLPERVPEKEFATLLRTHPVVQRFLLAKHPPLASFLDGILEEHKPIIDKRLNHEECQEALWEIADLIIYNKFPELFNTQAPIKWDLDEITSIAPLESKVIADVGAGSGRIAFMVAPLALTVFAVEPVTSLRSFMKERASRKKAENLYVMDGTLDSIPLPDNSLDVLITSNAIGWNLPDELKEIERVTRPGGFAIHMLRSDTREENPFHETLTSVPWKYSCLEHKAQNEMKIRYFKKI